MFSCEFYEISKNTFFTEHLRVTASELCQIPKQSLHPIRVFRISSLHFLLLLFLVEILKGSNSTR